MAAYRQVFDSRHLQAAKNRDQLWNPMLGNRVWANFFTAVALNDCCSIYQLTHNAVRAGGVAV